MNTDRMIVIYFSYQQEVLRQEEEEEERQRHLEQLIKEETEHQVREYSNDLSRMLQGITSASPHFIAQCRMNGPLIASGRQTFENCSICINDYQTNRHYARWPCAAGHMFHFDCMLDVLRAGNRCPLCRHPVDAANLPRMDFIFRLMQWRVLDSVQN